MPLSWDRPPSAPQRKDLLEEVALDQPPATASWMWGSRADPVSQGVCPYNCLRLQPQSLHTCHHLIYASTAQITQRVRLTPCPVPGTW